MKRPCMRASGVLRHPIDAAASRGGAAGTRARRTAVTGAPKPPFKRATAAHTDGDPIQTAVARATTDDTKLCYASARDLRLRATASRRRGYDHEQQPIAAPQLHERVHYALVTRASRGWPAWRHRPASAPRAPWRSKAWCGTRARRPCTPAPAAGVSTETDVAPSKSALSSWNLKNDPPQRPGAEMPLTFRHSSL